jgi:hypothetical protein
MQGLLVELKLQKEILAALQDAERKMQWDKVLSQSTLSCRWLRWSWKPGGAVLLLKLWPYVNVLAASN